MPMRAKRPCSYPGCPRLTDGQYCEEHKREMNRDYERFRRDPETKKRYGTAWRRIRKQYADTHPFCEECLAKGFLTPVEHVHHRIPLNDGGSNDFSNLESLCKSCHRSIHNRLEHQKNKS